MKRTLFSIRKTPTELNQADQIEVRRIVQLKTYEQPDPEALQRCSTEIHLRLAEWQHQQHQSGAPLTPGSLSGWRYGIAAAFICMIGVNGFVANQLPSLNSAEFAPAPDPLMFASTNEQFLTPIHRSNAARTVLTTFD